MALNWYTSVGDDHNGTFWDIEHVADGMEGTYSVYRYGDDRMWTASCHYGPMDNPREDYIGAYNSAEKGKKACEAFERWNERIQRVREERYG